MNLKICQTGPIQVNTYILTDEESKEAVIIDLGGSFETIKKELDENNFTIKYIINTHGHFDHVFGEVEVQKNFPNIPIYINEKDTAHFARLEEELRAWGFNVSTEPLKPTCYIDESSDLRIGKETIKIFETPGHSKGSLSFYTDGKIFTGDALFYRSIGRTDFFDGDYDELITSIKTKILTLPDDTKVYPGHGPSTSVAAEKKYNPYLK